MWKTCPECAQLFNGKRKQVHCSKACRGRFVRKQRMTFECCVCGTSVERVASQVKRATKSYCSTDCRTKDYITRMVGEGNPHWKGLTSQYECDNCGKTFELRDYHGSAYKYCSQECKGDHQRETLRGRNNPNYNHDKTEEERIKQRKYAEYDLWKVEVLRRDKFNCKKCGTNSKRDNRLVAHHIRNYSSYKEGRTDVDNGVTLCSNCHVKFHSIYGVYNNNQEQLNEFLNIPIGSA